MNSSVSTLIVKQSLVLYLFGEALACGMTKGILEIYKAFMAYLDFSKLKESVPYVLNPMNSFRNKKSNLSVS